MRTKTLRKNSMGKLPLALGPQRSMFQLMDPLSQALEGIRLRFMVPSAHEMTAPWGVRFGLMKPAELRKHAESLGVVQMCIRDSEYPLPLSADRCEA